MKFSLVQVLLRRSCGDPVQILPTGPRVKILKMLRMSLTEDLVEILAGSSLIGPCMKILQMLNFKSPAFLVKAQSEKAPILFEVLVKGGLSLRCASQFQSASSGSIVK